MKKVILSVAAFIFSLKLMAQAPEKMSYQAVVRNSSNGLVISAPVGMRISILQGSATGASVYTETQTVNSNSNGLVSLEIGSGTVVSGNFATIDWSADTYFIQTETDPTGGTTYTVTGTSQLMSVPYALHAKSAETVINNDDADADPANEIELPTGGINSQVLSTDGTGNYSWVDQTVNTLPDGTIAGQTAYWDGTSWVVNSNIFNTGGNIGIGTTTPTNNLHVATTTLAGGMTVSGPTPGYQLNNVGALGQVNVANEWATGTSNNDVVLRNSSTAGKLIFATGSTPATRMEVSPSGNVSIGTNNSFSRLNVHGSLQFTGGFSSPAGVIMEESGGSIVNLSMNYREPNKTNTTKGGAVRVDGRVGMNTIQFLTRAAGSSTEIQAMSITETNNVGIGTTTPAVKLHVNAVMRLEPQAAAPATAGKGDMYFNGTTNKLMVFDGSVWQACW